MVTLFTDVPGFSNDIADVIRLFLEITEVAPANKDAEPAPGDVHVCVTLSESGGEWAADCRVCRNGEDGLSEGGYIYRAAARLESELIKKRYMKRCVKIAVFRAMRELFCAYTPWGSLTGIRPTRLLRELVDEGGWEHARRVMKEDFNVAPDKLALAEETVRAQAAAFSTRSDEDVDIYIGIPFCRSRCLYCSFASEVRTEKTDMAAYLAALRRDISGGADIVRRAGRRVRAMYVGGGTPTVLTAQELSSLLSFALDAYGGFGTELTVEAGRPDTITKEKLSAMKRLGVTRISINPQTMNDDTLRLIGRAHGSADTLRAFAEAREAGFDNINMDIITGLIGETPGDVVRTLEKIEALAPENLTVHTLAIKRSSDLKKRLDEYPLLPAGTVDEMVTAGLDAARRMGLVPYYMYRQKYMRGNLENVGYAKPGLECVYNIDMMEETTSIMSHGAGAMTKRVFDSERRVERIPAPKDIAAYEAKTDKLLEEKQRLFLC